MIQFKDKDNNLLLDAIYSTGIANNQAILEIKIKYISPEFNGEYVYITKDDIGDQVMLYRFNLEDDFAFFELYNSTASIDKLYRTLGSFIDCLKITVSSYNKNKKQIYSEVKSKDTDMQVKNFK